METPYSLRLMTLYSQCLAENRRAMGMANDVSSITDQHDALDAATYLACYITLKAIHHLGRSPSEERRENFDMLSVYHAFATLIYVFLILPLKAEGMMPDVVKGAVMIGKSLFPELTDEECVECIESGTRKFQLVGDAEQDHLVNYRQDMDKAVIAFVVVGSDENAPFDKEEIVPLFGSLLNVLCEAFSN
jgi:hypothetical protein